jgi:hypothetical protein
MSTPAFKNVFSYEWDSHNVEQETGRGKRGGGREKMEGGEAFMTCTDKTAGE